MGGALLQFCATVLIARRLGEENSGHFFFWSAIVMSLATIATFGLDKLALQQVPRLERKDAIGALLGPMRLVSVLLSLVMGGQLIVYAWGRAGSGLPVWWYALLPLSLIGLSLCRFNAEVLKGLAHPLLAIHYRNLLPAGVFLVLILITGAKLDAEWTLAFMTIGFVVAGIGSLWSSAFSGTRPHFRWPEAGQTRRLFILGFPICACAIFASLNYMVPLAILERFHASRDVAFLTTSYRLFVLFELLAIAVHSISMPRLSRAAHASDWTATGKIFRSASLQGAALLGIPLLVAAIFSGSVMSLFGEGFVAGEGVLKVLMITGILSLLLGPVDELILMIGKTGRLAQFTAANLVLTLLLSFFVIPLYGAVGMAAVFGGGGVLKKILCLWYFRRYSRSMERGES